MALPQKERYTIEFINNLPEGTRAELIDGQIYYLATPTVTHQRILFKLSYSIGHHIATNKGTCEVIPAPFAVYLNDDGENHVEPDISVICSPNKIDEKGCHGAPDLIIEIVSPSSKKNDYYIKLFKYRTAGVREYWIVDPLKKCVTVHYFSDDSSPYYYNFTDNIKVNIYDDLYIDFNELNI